MRHVNYLNFCLHWHLLKGSCVFHFGCKIKKKFGSHNFFRWSQNFLSQTNFHLLVFRSLQVSLGANNFKRTVLNRKWFYIMYLLKQLSNIRAWEESNPALAMCKRNNCISQKNKYFLPLVSDLLPTAKSFEAQRRKFPRMKRQPSHWSFSFAHSHLSPKEEILRPKEI